MSQVKFTFVSVPDLDTELSFRFSGGGIDTPNAMETFKDTRTGVGTVERVTDRGNYSRVQTMYNYANAIAQDYNNTLLYTITPNFSEASVTIKANNTTLGFDLSSYLNTTKGAVTIEYISDEKPIFKIDSISASEATSNKCSTVRMSVTTSIQSDSIDLPISQAVSSNPFVFDAPRTSSPSIIRMSLTGQKANANYNVPFLTEDLFDIQIINTPSGATVNINAPTYQLVSFQYSLDDVTFKSIGTPTINLPIGSYTLYIRDNLGCQISIPFEIDEFTPNLIDYDGICEISNVNSIRYKENVQWTNCGIQKTIANTLSHQEPDELPINNYAQLFQKCDSPTTQLKSNYANIEAVIVDCSGNETSLTVNKMTNNMNKIDVRDGQVLRVNGNNYTGRLSVRFNSGNTYDPDTMNVDGNYNTGGYPMDWIDIGEYVNIQGVGWLKVDDIIVEPNVTGRILVLNTNWSNYSYSQNQTVIISTVYNLLDFERYEFTPSLLALDGYYQIRVNCTDPMFDDKQFVSEWMNVKEEHPNCYVMEYYNTENNEINYSTGIRMILRIPYMFNLKWKPNSDQDIYVTDTKTVLMESKVREFYDFKAKSLPTAMAQKVVLALAQDRLFINGESYLMEGEPESNSLGNTNLYQIFATLVKSNYVFDSNSGIGIGEVQLPEGSPLAINSDASGLLFVD